MLGFVKNKRQVIKLGKSWMAEAEDYSKACALEEVERDSKLMEVGKERGDITGQTVL